MTEPPSLTAMIVNRSAELTRRAEEIEARIEVGEGSAANAELTALVDEMEFLHALVDRRGGELERVL